MSAEGRSAIIGLSGFFAGALTASIVPWSPLSKSVLVGVVALLVSTLVWALLRLKTSTNRPR